MATYTHEELYDKSLEDLEAIKQQKMEELSVIRNQQYVLISNILSLQGMIKAEKGKLMPCKE